MQKINSQRFEEVIFYGLTLCRFQMLKNRDKIFEICTSQSLSSGFTGITFSMTLIS